VRFCTSRLSIQLQQCSAVQCSSFGCVQWSVTRQRERNNLQVDETSCLLFLSIP
jgi:hypothetical protein